MDSRTRRNGLSKSGIARIFASGAEPKRLCFEFWQSKDSDLHLPAVDLYCPFGGVIRLVVWGFLFLFY